MPLMKPEIQKVLRAAGLAKEASNPDTPLSEKLDAAGLSVDELLEELAHLAKNSGNEALRLKAVETSLKAHGALKDSAPQVPSFTIVIQDSGGQLPSQSPETNSTVNPILLPRQLLSSLSQLENKDKPN